MAPRKCKKKFFRQIESNYEQLISSIQPRIEHEFQNWKEDFKILDFQKEFKAVYLSLPLCEKEIKDWEIAFETEHDLNHTFTIMMSDFKTTGIVIDG